VDDGRGHGVRPARQPHRAPDTCRPVSPEGLKTVNLSYRYLSGDITQSGPTKQIDLSAQWPLFGRWYGVGRFNYSLPDSRVIEGIGGFEYAAAAWTTRPGDASDSH